MEDFAKSIKLFDINEKAIGFKIENIRENSEVVINISNYTQYILTYHHNFETNFSVIQSLTPLEMLFYLNPRFKCIILSDIDWDRSFSQSEIKSMTHIIHHFWCGYIGYMFLCHLIETNNNCSVASDISLGLASKMYFILIQIIKSINNEIHIFELTD